MTAWTHDRQRAAEQASRAKRIDAGARRMPGGLLPARAAQALDSLMRAGYADSLVGCISRALVDASKRR